MSHYKPYPAYKDSGVEWLGQVPAHWQLRRLKHMARFSGGGTPSRDNPDFWNGDIPWVSPKDMKSEFVKGAEEYITAAGLSESSSSMVPAKRMLMVVRSGILKHTIPVAVNDVPVALNQDMKAIWLDPAFLSARFFMRWIQGLNDDLLKAWLKQGATVESIEQDYLADTLMPVPPVSEREHIVKCLDRETARLDTLIEKKTRFIELLREKRQALIAHAVTKGLDPRVKMKDSRVEWLGEVPEHWNISTLNHLVRFRSGGTPSKDNLEFWDGYIPWASAKDLKQEVLADTIDHLTESAIESGAASLIPSGSILVVVRGMILARFFPVVETLVPMAINQDLKALIPSENINGRYLAQLLRGSSAESLSRLEEAGHGTKALRMENWISIKLPVPPLHEQLAIVAMLDTQSARIETLADKNERSIDLLKERRSALITAAVTGQIDLREAV
jgi:type I restriction enzyme S subunit